jgi:hypothetical protein
MSAKTVSMGIVQHPGYAILGYGFGMGCMLVCSTVLSIVLCSWWILVCAFTTYVAMLLVLGYAQIGGIPHFVAACVAIVGAAVTHLCILVVLQMRTGNGLGVYAVAVFIVFSSAALLACVALDDSLREEKRFALLEHLSIGFEVLTFVWTAFEVFAAACQYHSYLALCCWLCDFVCCLCRLVGLAGAGFLGRR